MRYLRTLAYVTFKTFTSPAYYADILKARFAFSFKFYLVFWFLFATMTAVTIVPQVVPVVSQITRTLPARLIDLYPSELQLTIIDGQVSTNMVEPIYFPFSDLERLFNDIPRQVLGASTQQIDYFLVIDTQAQIEDFKDYRSYSLLTQDHFVYINDQNNLEVVSLDNMDDLTINRQMIDAFLVKIQPYLELIPTFVLIFLLIAIYFGVAWAQLVYLLFFTCITWLIAQLLGLKLAYAKSYQIGLHLLVPVTTVLGLLSLAELNPGFPFFRTLLMTIIMTAILMRIKELVSAPKVQSVQPSDPSSK